jgi:hypothetical protein
MKKHLVIGYGEVGKAIFEVLKHADMYVRAYDPYLKVGIDMDETQFDVLHICIPYIPHGFKRSVKGYRKQYKSPLVIVHSTVPVGICDKLQVVHSPVRGVHPHLADGLWTFVKYFGGVKAKEAAEIFKKADIQTKVFKHARTTEALKLWETTQYGYFIMLEKKIYEWCKKRKVKFEDVYQVANKDYNSGYVQLGRSEVVRPHLRHVEGKIGGHCVIANCKMLNSEVSKEIIEFNKTL